MKILSGPGEGQVLQRRPPRGAEAFLSGTCDTPGPVLATLATVDGPMPEWTGRPCGEAGQGSFSARLDDIPAGGPYRLALAVGSERAEIASFFVGDVWLLAGQSNMEGIADMTAPAEPDPLVRALSLRSEWRLATDPLHVLWESPHDLLRAFWLWREVRWNIGDPFQLPLAWQADLLAERRQWTPDEAEAYRRTTTKGAGVGVWFGREMRRRSGVPQGLLCQAHGGSSLRQWDPAPPAERASLYSLLVETVRATGQPVAGVLWYQGESDASPENAPLYAERMKRLVAALRRDLGQPGLPWLTVQIARSFNPAESAPAWNAVQEQQRRLPHLVEGLEVAAAVDLPLDDLIHLGAAAFPRLAARLARCADRLVYLNSQEEPSPRLQSIRVRHGGGMPSSTRIEVSFEAVPGGLRAAGEPSGFTLALPNGIPQPVLYKTVLRDNVAILHVALQSVEGLLLSYGHGTTPYCNITDGRDFSLPVFGPIPLTATAKSLDLLRKAVAEGHWAEAIRLGRSLEEGGSPAIRAWTWLATVFLGEEKEITELPAELREPRFLPILWRLAEARSGAAILPSPLGAKLLSLHRFADRETDPQELMAVDRLTEAVLRKESPDSASFLLALVMRHWLNLRLGRLPENAILRQKIPESARDIPWLEAALQAEPGEFAAFRRRALLGI